MPLLPPGLDASDYRITDSLAGVRSWQARILTGNSARHGQTVGDWDAVSYVMAAVRGAPAFIPLACADEHNMGFDVLRSRARKWRIRTRDFFPLLSCRGQTGLHIHEKEDVPDALEALRRWHAAGGPDLLVKVLPPGGRGGYRAIGSLDFLAGNGTAVAGPGGLLPIGQRFVDRLNELAAAVAGVRSPDRPWLLEPASLSANRRVMRAAQALAETICSVRMLATAAFWRRGGGFSGGGTLGEAAAAWRAALDTAVNGDDFGAVERLVFTHDGVKNAVHMAIRAELAGDIGHMAEIFGDLALANDLLGRITPGLDGAGPDPVPDGPRR